ncbi:MULTISPECIES: hypothetical protein [unclassified Frankia]|uniref:hypothetical protein n=1 Tax=unclassified Frankia TaxID=2632575 RepID=UPI002AD56B33|nr:MULTISPECIES: hypothetical protein [unclassified Frankia]
MTSAPTADNPLAVFGPQHRADPYPVYRRIREGGALQPIGPTLWLAPRYQECEAAPSTANPYHRRHVRTGSTSPAGAARSAEGNCCRLRSNP